MTQHDKIKELYATQEWVCQIDFWKISKSPHTRRREIKEEGRYYFKERPCIHGHDRIYDYAMIENGNYVNPVKPKPQIIIRDNVAIIV